MSVRGEMLKYYYFFVWCWVVDWLLVKFGDLNDRFVVDNVNYIFYVILILILEEDI